MLAKRLQRTPLSEKFRVARHFRTHAQESDRLRNKAVLPHSGSASTDHLPHTLNKDGQARLGNLVIPLGIEFADLEDGGFYSHGGGRDWIFWLS